jgi:hypothetical protein
LDAGNLATPDLGGQRDSVQPAVASPDEGDSDYDAD